MSKDKFTDEDKIRLSHEFDMAKLRYMRETELILLERTWELNNYSQQNIPRVPQRIQLIEGEQPEETKFEISKKKYSGVPPK